MEIIAHRGASGHAPENTLLAFKQAISIGCNGIEMDVRLSKDNRAIVIHDSTINRTTNGKGKVAKMTLEEIKKNHCAEKQKIPLLEEVLELCQNKIKFFIELKSPGTPEAVNKIISNYKIVQDVVIISFNFNLLKEIKKLNPQIEIGYLFKNYWLDYFLKPFWNQAKKIRLSRICPRFDIITPQMTNKAHELGLKVYVWGINDKKLADKMKILEADEIATDFPKIFYENGIKK